jgi:hypothetical protein
MQLDFDDKRRDSQPGYEAFNVQHEEERHFEELSDEHRCDERLLMEHDQYHKPNGSQGAEKKRAPESSKWPTIIAIMLMSSIVIVNAVVMSVYFISEALGHHVDYLPFGIVFFLDIVFFGGLLFILAVHAVIFLWGKLMQLVGDSHFFFIYVRLLHNSLSIGIFFWCMSFSTDLFCSDEVFFLSLEFYVEDLYYFRFLLVSNYCAFDLRTVCALHLLPTAPAPANTLHVCNELD